MNEDFWKLRPDFGLGRLIGPEGIAAIEKEVEEESMKTLLALDLGTTTGWCAGTEKQHNSGVWSLKPSRWEGGGMKFVKFRQCLNEIHAAMTVDLVVYEIVRAHAGVDAAHSYGGLLALLTEWCETIGISYEGASVGEIKRHWTGKGNAPKAKMIEVARSMGYAPVDDNEADALALFHLKVGSLGNMAA